MYSAMIMTVVAVILTIACVYVGFKLRKINLEQDKLK